MSEKDSMLDSFMKGLGRQLGRRRKEVHKAIDRFHEEANRDAAATPSVDPADTSKPPAPHPEHGTETTGQNPVDSTADEAPN